ncbi:MAG: DUF551 domain-containing protein [Desulfatiglandales bacterium]
MSEWISVEDRIPEKGGVVMSFYGGLPVMVSREDEGWRVLMLGRDLRYGLHGNYAPFNATHWMPLPEPPVKE